MLKKINSFSEFLNEASLRGNLGIPGEEGSGRESWLDKITARSNAAAREFFNQNQADIQNFMGLIQRSMALQDGHEEALSQLATDSFVKLYGSLLEDITLDLKIVTRGEIKSEMEKTPTDKENIELEELEDQEIIDQVHKRKILRTIQQGKGLNSKSILNLSLFKDGLVEILGPQDAAEYLTVLNKISNVAQFFDWDMPEEMQKQMWQTRQGFSGSCDIEFDEKKAKDEENKEDIAQKVLDDLAAGDDVIDNENAEELVDGLGVRIIARGIDLSVLIHESIKGIYKLITQAALEALYGGSAEKVLMNTDTLFDELQEIKFGRQMQSAFFKIVREHPDVIKRVNQMLVNDLEDWQVSSFQERLDYLFFNEIAQLGQEKAKEMLEVVNAILSESSDAKDMCDPLIRKALHAIDQEEEYQAWKRGEHAEPTDSDDEPEFDLPAPKQREETMTQDEINDAIIDAYSRGDMAEVARLEKLLK
jgi:hypothetical protein